MVRPFSGSSIRHGTAHRGRIDTLNRERRLFTIAAGSSWAILHLDGTRVDTKCGYDGHMNYHPYLNHSPYLITSKTKPRKDFYENHADLLILAASSTTLLLWDFMEWSAFYTIFDVRFRALRYSGSRRATNNNIGGSAHSRNVTLTAPSAK